MTRKSEVYDQDFIVGGFSDVEWWTCLLRVGKSKRKMGLVKLQKSPDSKLRGASSLSKLSSPHAGHSSLAGGKEHLCRYRPPHQR